MASIKIANELAKNGNIIAAINEYESVGLSNPRLKKLCEFNISFLKKRLDPALISKQKNLEKNSTEPQQENLKKSEDKRIIKDNSVVYFYSSEESSWLDWKKEFGPGEFFFDPNRNSLNLKSKSARFYLSKEFKFTQGMHYIVSLKVKKIKGDLGNIFAVVQPQSFLGNTEILGKKISQDGNYAIRFEAKESCNTSIRIGIGTTTAVNSEAEIEIEFMTVIEQFLPKREISNFAKDYIDPEFVLPELFGLGNDYSFIEEKAKALLNSSKTWQKKKVSIVIPAYERVNLLKNTLATIIRQDYPLDLIDVVIVDDGSKESNCEFVFNEFSSKINLYLAKQVHKGYGLCRARNLGARSAQGEILFFLDSDILLPSNFIRTLMSFHHVSDDCTLLGIRRFINSESVEIEDLISGKLLPEDIKKCEPANPHLQKFKDEMGVSIDWRETDFQENNNLKSATNPFRYFGGGHASISKDKFIEIGGFDESFSEWGNEDQEFAYRLWSRGQYFIPLLNIYDFHQEEPSKQIDQSYKLDQNTRTHKLLISKCPDFSVRKKDKKNDFEIPLFSIYIPAYNVESYIEACIESAINQTYKDFEIVVVNDGSTDNTLKILQKYNKHPKVKIISKTNGGRGSASNKAIQNASGEYIVQLDSDDILYPDALEKLADFFSKNIEIECVYTNYTLIDKDGNKIGDGWSPPNFDRYDNLVGMSMPHLRSFRRGLYYRTEGFDEALTNAVDYDFFLKLSTVTKISHLNDALYYYRVHSAQTSTALKSEQLKNHEVAVTQYLTSLGLSDFYAKSYNPFEPQRNFIVRKASFFEYELSKKVFVQPEIESLTLPVPKCPGNDYSEMADFIKDYYAKNLKNYSEKISIIVPVYNRAERLSRCLAGIWHQTYPRKLIEVVVVDDGSSDEVMRVIDKYSNLLDLKYVKQSDDGYRLSAARNLGIRTSSYDNISIIDCDLIPLPGFIESFMQYLHHFENVVLLGHQRFVDPTGISDDDILKDVENLKKFKDIKSENSTMEDTPDGITRDWRYKLYEETNYLKNDEFPYRAFSSGHVAYKKKVIIDAGMYDEDFNVWGCEDNEAGYRIYQKGYYFIPILEAIDLHQEPPSGKNETDREADRQISRNLLQKKLPAMRGWFGKSYELQNDDAPLISVCIPVHNTGHFAKLAVDSVLNQTMKDFEIIIYDDASNDGTLEMLRSEYSSNPKVIFIEGKTHKNVTYARNELIKSSRGEFVGFLDSDDLLKPDCLNECVKLFRGSPDVGLICTNYEKINEDGNFIESGWEPPDLNRSALMFGNIFTHFRAFRIRDWNRCIKWNSHELVNLKYGEDWDLCLKISEVTNFSRVKKSLYQYRVRATSITNNSNFEFKSNQTLMVINNTLSRHNFNLKAIRLSLKEPHKFGITK
jgi:chondroitin synthase